MSHKVSGRKGCKFSFTPLPEVRRKFLKGETYKNDIQMFYDLVPELWEEARSRIMRCKK